MRIYPLDKVILSFRPQADVFLNGLTSNTSDKPKNAFLDVHGKIVATFDQFKVDENLIYALVESKYEGVLLAHLDKYLRLSKVQVRRENWLAYYDLDNTADVTVEFMFPQKSGRIMVVAESFPATIRHEEFTLFRLRHDIPLHGQDYHDEMVLNVSMTDFVSFSKGCFLGQEPVSKVYNRSKPPRRLTVKFEDECSEQQKAAMTSRAHDPKTGRTLGFVFESVDNRLSESASSFQAMKQKSNPIV